MLSSISRIQLRVSHNSSLQSLEVILGHHTDKDLSVTMLRGLSHWGQEGSRKGAWVLCRGGLSLRDMGSGITHTPFSLPIPNILCQTFRMRKLTATLCLTLTVVLRSVFVVKVLRLL